MGPIGSWVYQGHVVFCASWEERDVDALNHQNCWLQCPSSNKSRIHPAGVWQGLYSMGLEESIGMDMENIEQCTDALIV